MHADNTQISSSCGSASGSVWIVPGIAALLSVASAVFGAQSGLSEGEQRGKAIYELGVGGGSTPIEAAANGDVRLRGGMAACANCHGRDGAGKPEGGVVPSNLTWQALTKPYGAAHPTRGAHPPYTERLLIRAITMGIDPAGNDLHAAMPRYSLSQADAADLAAYLKRLGEIPERGVSDGVVRFAVFVPQSGRNPLTRALLDYSARVNGAGGVFGRRIELAFLDPARDAVDREAVFAVLEDVPGDIGEEIEALSAFAARRYPNAAVSVIGGDSETQRRARERLPQTAGDNGPLVLYLGGELPRDGGKRAILAPGSVLAGATLPPATEVYVARRSPAEGTLLALVFAVEAMKVAGRQISRENYQSAWREVARAQSGHYRIPVHRYDARTGTFTRADSSDSK